MGNVRVTNSSSQAVAQSGTAHTQRTISSTAVNVLNHTLSADTTHVLVQFNNANARITFDGTTPTTTLGFIYADGASSYWTPRMLSTAKAIRTAGTDVIAEIQELNSL